MIKKILFEVKQLFKYFTQIFLLPLVYNLYRYKPIVPNTIIFADARHDDIPFSLRLLYEELCQKDYNIIIYTHDFSKISYLRSLIIMFRFMKLYATASHVFICDYYLPIASCNKKKATQVIQTWHAGGPMKKFGYDSSEDIPSFYKANVFKNYDLVTASADFMVNIMTRNMRQPVGVVRPIGFSRTDCYFNPVYIQQCSNNFYSRYPYTKGKKIILWAPTFRGNAANPFLVGTQYIQQLQSQLGDEWFVIIKAHPHIDAKTQVSNCDIPTENLLSIANILITDYSSILYDYMAMSKPIILFAPDLQTYINSRGLYIDYYSLPCSIVTDPKELLPNILNINTFYNKSKMEQCYAKYMGKCNGRATKRILKTLNL